MDREKYKGIVSKYSPKENRLYNGIISFFIGGLIGVLGQLLIDVYSLIFNLNNKESGILMIITLIFFSCLFTSLGFFDKLVGFAKCGLIIPITGFAHSMMSTTLEYKKEGIVTGMGANMFRLAGTVIMCGVVSAYFFGLIRYLIMEV